jgi:CheY-like chemotaxis protein
MGNTLSGRPILVVEDDYYSATELAAQLKSMGADVVGPVPDVAEALQYIRSRPDLQGAVLDINLGGQMVFAVADELERRALPFVFATGYEPDVVPTRHADKVLLRKPLEGEALEAALLQAAEAGGVTEEDACRNGLLARLPAAELAIITPLLRHGYNPRGAIIEQRGQVVRRVCFPLDCVLSLITIGREGSRLETGLIGKEGMSGFGLVDGDDLTPYELVNQVEGSMLSMSAEDFKDVLTSAPSLEMLASRFGRSLGIQVSYTALANGRSEIRQRLARWLVMIQDRIQGNAFRVTHEYLALMLGVRRPSVTDTLHLLEGDRLIRSTRGCVEILDRQGLVNVAGEVYGSAEAEYERLMGLPLLRADAVPPFAQSTVLLTKSAS